MFCKFVFKKLGVCGGVSKNGGNVFVLGYRINAFAPTAEIKEFFICDKWRICRIARSDAICLDKRSSVFCIKIHLIYRTSILNAFPNCLYINVQKYNRRKIEFSATRSVRPSVKDVTAFLRRIRFADTFAFFHLYRADLLSVIKVNRHIKIDVRRIWRFNTTETRPNANKYK